VTLREFAGEPPWVKVGERVSFDDGLVSGQVQATDGGKMWVRIEQTPPRGAHLKADKGINFHDSALPAITEEDAKSLKKADLVGLSFVEKPPGIVLNIETRRGSNACLPSSRLRCTIHASAS
jgi:pyruvate kinase